MIQENMEREMGFEPTTPCLEGRGSVCTSKNSGKVYNKSVLNSPKQQRNSALTQPHIYYIRGGNAYRHSLTLHKYLN